MLSPSALLLLSDGRLPVGGHIHSGGLEEAVNDGRIATTADLGRYLVGRLHTVGVSDAGMAAATCLAAPAGWADLDTEAAARCPVPALRTASRSQGRGLVRTGRRMWPGSDLAAAAAVHADGPLWSVGVGACARAAGLDAPGAALVAAQASVSGPAWAAVRLLGLDPVAVAAVLADLAPTVDAIAGTAAGAASLEPPARLPAPGGPLMELGAATHATREVQLFAS